MFGYNFKLVIFLFKELRNELLEEVVMFLVGEIS